MVMEIIIAAFLVIGGVFGLVGNYGLIKLDHPMARLHAPTKATTLGVGGVLIASMIYSFVFEAEGSLHELLITLFLFITAPITANFISKAYLHRHAHEETLPEPNGDTNWAVLERPEWSPEPEKTQEG